MKKEILTLFIFLMTIAVVTIPIIFLTSAAINTDSFQSNVTVTSDSPVIESVNATATAPSEGGLKVIQLEFNVSDNNSKTDMNISSIVMNITHTLGSEATRSAVGSNCTSRRNSSDTLSQVFWCNITIYYYDREGTWDICAYIEDMSGGSDSNCVLADFTMNSLDAIDVVNASMLLTGASGEDDVGPGHIIINNTGNQNYTNMSLNATFLYSGSQYIGVSNFSVNITDNESGQSLIENTWMNITTSNLIRGQDSNLDLYFYVDIPAGLNPDTYDADRNWMIDGEGAT